METTGSPGGKLKEGGAQTRCCQRLAPSRDSTGELFLRNCGGHIRASSAPTGHDGRQHSSSGRLPGQLHFCPFLALLDFFKLFEWGVFNIYLTGLLWGLGKYILKEPGAGCPKFTTMTCRWSWTGDAWEALLWPHKSRKDIFYTKGTLPLLRSKKTSFSPEMGTLKLKKL